MVKQPHNNLNKQEQITINQSAGVLNNYSDRYYDFNKIAQQARPARLSQLALPPFLAIKGGLCRLIIKKINRHRLLVVEDGKRAWEKKFIKKLLLIVTTIKSVTVGSCLNI